MSDNPFAEPDDSDRTVIRPAPGGRRPTPASQPPIAPAPQAAAAPPTDPSLSLSVGTTPLLAAAQPLLQLLARLRNTLSQPDPAELRERAAREMRGFEKAAHDSGVPMEQLRPAHYALCASLDDLVLNTPWGSQGAWDTRSLVSTFHQEVRAGERFFDVLTQLKQNPGTNLPVLELMYLCLSLGFQGRYRLTPRGPAEIEKLREDLYTTITRQRDAVEPALSPHWRGASAPYRPKRAALPVWVVAAAGMLGIAGLFVWFSNGLNAASDDLFERMLQAPPAQMPDIARTASAVQPPPPPPAPLEPGVLDRLRAFLRPEIDAGLVVVLGDDDTPMVRIRNRGVFASGSATVQPQFVPLLERIGTALKAEPGPVQVLGHTDNQPIRTVQFPSNFALSTARAQAALAIVAHTIGDPGRLKAEGRADSEPLETNATPQGRDENRRIEIVLHRQS